MIWFILNDEQNPVVFVDGQRAYAVLDVIKPPDSTEINNECEELIERNEELNITRISYVNPRDSRVTDLMIAQFFDRGEGLDRDWQDEYNYEAEQYREELIVEN
jgi:hypothetical protein